MLFDVDSLEAWKKKRWRHVWNFLDFLENGEEASGDSENIWNLFLEHEVEL